MGGIGSSALKRHRTGKRLTRQEAIEAACAACMNDYLDGRFDCLIETCPLHPFMPYRGREPENAAEYTGEWA